MNRVLLWNEEPQEPYEDIRDIITHKAIGVLISRLGFIEPYTIDFGSEEVVTIIWNEKSEDGPDLILLENGDITVTDLFIETLGLDLKSVERIYKELWQELKNNKK